MDEKHSNLAAAWPAVVYEKLAWESANEQFSSNRLRRAAKEPIQAAIPATIAEQSLVVSSEMAAEIEEVSAAITRFDQSQSALELPFAAVLLRTESASSSEVEQITASAKQLGLAELGRSQSSNADLVVDNVHSMELAITQSSEIDISAILRIHKTLLNRSRPDIAGKIRARQVWIGGSVPQFAQFVPPAHSRVSKALEDLTDFCKRTDLPVIALLAIAHAQFETIHPFEDGNGRTGRALVQVMLRNFGLTTKSTLPLSAGLLHDTRGYFRALEAYRAGNPGDIIKAFINAGFSAIENGNQLSSEILEIVSEWKQAFQLRSDSTANRLIANLHQSPVLNSAKVQELLGVSEPTAIAALGKLQEAGILHPIKNQRRNRVWFSPEILEAYEAFGARARRRR
jgi:Fic family protein